MHIAVKLMSDGRLANRNASAVTAWIGGMSITQDGNVIAPDKMVHHVHRYASPHYNPHGHHYHRWNHEPGGSEDPLYATKTVYGAGYIDENRMYDWYYHNVNHSLVSSFEEIRSRLLSENLGRRLAEL